MRFPNLKTFIIFVLLLAHTGADGYGYAPNIFVGRTFTIRDSIANIYLNYYNI